MRKVKTHSFNGIRYQVLIGHFDGVADTDDKYSIVVNGELDTRKDLITLIHEAMHAGNWAKHEDTIDRSSTEIGKLLWRLGYRRK
jgi:hypothetical protein